MANICENLIYVYTEKENKETLIKFYEMLDETDGRFGELLPTYEDKSNAGGYLYDCTLKAPYCREDEIMCFHIKGNSKWAYPNNFFKYLFSKYNIKGLKVGYYAEEPGCELFEKYDPLGIYDKINFYVSNDKESFCADNIEEVLEAMQDYMSEIKTKKFRELKSAVLKAKFEDSVKFFNDIGGLPIKLDLNEGKLERWFNIYRVEDRNYDY